MKNFEVERSDASNYLNQRMNARGNPPRCMEHAISRSRSLINLDIYLEADDQAYCSESLLVLCVFQRSGKDAAAMHWPTALKWSSPVWSSILGRSGNSVSSTPM